MQPDKKNALNVLNVKNNALNVSNVKNNALKKIHSFEE